MAAGSSSGQKTDSLDISMQSDDDSQQVAAAPVHIHNVQNVPVALRPPLMDIILAAPLRPSIPSPVRFTGRDRTNASAGHGPIVGTAGGSARVDYLSRNNSPASSNRGSMAESALSPSWQNRGIATPALTMSNGGASQEGAPGSSFSQALSVNGGQTVRSIRAASPGPTGSTINSFEQVQLSSGPHTPNHPQEFRYVTGVSGMFSGQDAERNLVLFRGLLNGSVGKDAFTNAYHNVNGLRQQMSNLEAEQIANKIANNAAAAKLQQMRWQSQTYHDEAQQAESNHRSAEAYAHRYADMVEVLSTVALQELSARDASIHFLENMLAESNSINSEQESYLERVWNDASKSCAENSATIESLKRSLDDGMSKHSA